MHPETPPGPWPILRDELRRLLELTPSPLQGYPDPRVDEGRRPPFRVRLSAWAAQDAQRLHDLLGDDVMLTVGAMLFTEMRAPRPRPAPEALDGDDRVGVACRESLRARSGHELHARAQLTNLSEVTVDLRYSGRSRNVVGLVCNPATREIVSGQSGYSRLMGGTFTLEPGAEIDLPLTVYTDSVLPRLGCAVPAGQWATRVVVRYADGTVVHSAPLALTVS